MRNSHPMHRNVAILSLVSVLLLFLIMITLPHARLWWTGDIKNSMSRKDMIAEFNEAKSVEPFDVDVLKELLIRDYDNTAFDYILALGDINREKEKGHREFKEAMGWYKGNKYDSFIGILRTTLLFSFDNFSGTTNRICSVIESDDKQLRGYFGKWRINIHYEGSNAVEVMDGVYLLESEWKNYSELTNFFHDVINEELDGITTGRTRVRIPKRKFSDDVLNQMIWGK